MGEFDRNMQDRSDIIQDYADSYQEAINDIPGMQSFDPEPVDGWKAPTHRDLRKQGRKHAVDSVLADELANIYGEYYAKLTDRELKNRHFDSLTEEEKKEKFSVPTLADAVKSIVDWFTEEPEPETPPDNTDDTSTTSDGYFDRHNDEGRGRDGLGGGAPGSDVGGGATSGGRNCFVAETPILMADGTTKVISSIKEGDKVAAFDNLGKLSSGVVVAKYNYDDREVLSVNGILEVTEAHRFLTESGTYKAIGEFSPGENLVNSNGEKVIIDYIERLSEKKPVFNFTVEPFNTYVANNIRVHNVKTMPIAVDLNGDGEIALVDIEEAAVFFDTDGDGYEEKVGWVNAEDGFLVIDINNDGNIIGDELAIAAQTEEDDTDLEAVAALYDTNLDGVLDNQDADFDKFRIWQDLNQNGAVDDNELKTLAEWGIESVNLSVVKATTQIENNQLLGTTSLTKTDGSQSLVGDVALQTSDFSSRFENSEGVVKFKVKGGISYYFADAGVTLDASASDLEVNALFGSDQSDNLSAGEQVDVLLSGGDNNDTLTGGSGNDTLSGGSGIDSLQGGAGHDTLYIDSDDASIDGGEGYDVAIVSNQSAVTLNLNASNIEAAIGNKGNDDFSYQGREDISLRGEDGDDILRAGDGDDLLVGGLGADRFHAGAGDDRLFVDAEDNQADIRAGEGNDWIFVSTAQAVNLDLNVIQAENALGNDGNDVFRNNSSKDAYIDGQGGNDDIKGGTGNDIIQGGQGEDTLDGSDGFDLVSYETSQKGIEIDLSSNTVSGGDGTGDSIVNFEGAIGSTRGDILRGNTQNNVLFGNGGNDLIEGNVGADFLDGGLGNDTASYVNSNAGVSINLKERTFSGGHAEGDQLVSIESLIGSSQNDSLTGDDNDNVFEGAAGADTLDGGLGKDTISYSSSNESVVVDLEDQTASGGHADGDVFSGFENAEGSTYDDNLTSQIAGSRLYGLAGNDTLTGQAGSDVINGGAGADALDGGAGVDTLNYEGSDTGVNVNLQTGAASGGHAEGDTISNFENIQGSYHDDTLIGDSTDNVIEGDLGADSIDGGAGIDTASYEDAFYGVDVDLKRGGGRQHDQLQIEIDSTRRSGSVAIDALNNKRALHQGAELSTAYTLAAIAAASGWATTSLALDSGTDVSATVGALLSVQHNLGAGEVRPQDMAYLDVSFDGDTAIIRYHRADGSLEGQFTVKIADSTTHKVSFGYDKYTGASVVSIDGQVAGSYNWISGLDVMAGSYGSNGATATHEEADGGFIYSLGLLTDEAVNDTLTNIENLRGSDNGDRLAGDDGDNVIEGNGGNDIINGGLGADTLSGGAGDDLLIGGESNGDTYRFNRGDGHDVIINNGVNGKVVFGEGIRAPHITFEKINNDLKVYYVGLEDDVLVTEITDGTAYSSSVTSLPNGDYVVLWNSSLGVFVQKYTPSGIVIGAEKKINNPGNDPSLIILKDGDYVLTWNTGTSASFPGNGKIQRYDKDFSPVGSEITVSNESIKLTTTSLSDGGFVAAWASLNSDGDSYGISLQRYDASGTKVGSEVVVNTYIEDFQVDPKVSPLADGGFVVLWEKGSSSPGKFISQRFNDKSEPVGPEISINTNKASGHADVVGLADGSYSISWISTENGNDKVFTKNIPPSAYSDATIKDWYLDDKNKVSFELNDGTAIALEGLTIKGNSEANVINGTSYDDTLVGLDGNDTLIGGDGQDTLKGGSGADELIGGRGQDYLYGGDSNGDIYRSNYGDGTDYIFNNGLNGKVIFGSGIGLKDLEFGSNGDDLTVAKNVGAKSAVVIKNWFHDIKHQVAFELADGTNVNLTIADNNNNTLTGTVLNDVFLGQDGDDVINGGSGNDLLFGEYGNDTLNGDAGDDIIKGSFGDDILNGGDGDDILYSGWRGLNHLTGGKGADTLYGEGTSTIYHYNLGDGKDVISNISGTGKLIYGEGISAEDLTFTKQGNSLVVILSPEDQIEIKEWFFRDDRQISFELSDGSLLPEIKGVVIYDDYFHGNIVGTEYNDKIYGNGGYDRINGGAGDDLIDGGTESDILTGGAGNDILIGGNSDGDEYHYNAGDGFDIIRNTGQGAKIKLGQGIELDDINFVQAGNDLDLVFTNKVIAPIHDIEVKVNTTSEKEQKKPSIATFKDGSYVVAWEAEQDGSNNGIYLQRFDSNGSPIDVETRINSTTANWQSRPSVTTLVDNGYVVAWHSKEQDGSDYGIYLQRYAADGSTVGGETQVNTYTSGNQFFSSIEALLDGGYAVVWQSQGQDGSEYGIYLQRYTANGTPLGSETQVNTTTTNWQNSASLTSLADGGYIVTWESYGNPPIFNGLIQ
ncbi:polymorphic toxin-type HINT domain-containing protein [Kiloniella laminariae]|uniref:polymorphic toxin-type HINT domain-containing protein n=1 Tax=Kiloniella laminariae TaxID=454162 RepID=UPI0003827792|nr:polymorphic toxin-type HINT domain-containing protein [Kiloniella laminariae]